jgi:putative phosphoesterase
VRVGLISDTHGLLRPQALAALQGCDHIVHGGDIGNAAILEQLRAIAPLTVVRGNNDKGDWAAAIGESETIELAGVRLHAIHDVKELAIDPGAEGVQVVVSGHSLKP